MDDDYFSGLVSTGRIRRSWSYLVSRFPFPNPGSNPVRRLSHHGSHSSYQYADSLAVQHVSASWGMILYAKLWKPSSNILLDILRIGQHRGVYLRKISSIQTMQTLRDNLGYYTKHYLACTWCCYYGGRRWRGGGGGESMVWSRYSGEP